MSTAINTAAYVRKSADAFCGPIKPLTAAQYEAWAKRRGSTVQEVMEHHQATGEGEMIKIAPARGRIGALVMLPTCHLRQTPLSALR